jgi:hypothetical protein
MTPYIQSRCGSDVTNSLEMPKLYDDNIVNTQFRHSVLC